MHALHTHNINYAYSSVFLCLLPPHKPIQKGVASDATMCSSAKWAARNTKDLHNVL